MPIQEIVDEKTRNGEISDDLAMEFGGRSSGVSQNRRQTQQNSRQSRPQQRVSQTALDTDFGKVEVSKADIQLAVDVSILVVLLLIWSRL